MKWEAADWIRIVALIGALVLFSVGTWMVVQGIDAEGAIDIKSSVVSGSLKTGSAGLFIAFLSFVVIVFVLSSLPRKASGVAPSPVHERSRFKRLLPVFWALLIAIVGSVIAASLVDGGARFGFGLLAGGLGFFLLLVVIALLTFLETDE